MTSSKDLEDRVFHAKEIIMQASNDGRSILLEPEAKALISLFNIRVPQFYVVRNGKEAVKAANILGFPVVLKIVSPDIMHKSDMKAAEFNIIDQQALQQSLGKLTHDASIRAEQIRLEGFLIEKMIPGTLEAKISGLRDRQFGPVVMFGLGGQLAELLDDVSFRTAPFSSEDAHNMIMEIKGDKLLTDFRESELLDIQSVERVIMEIARIMCNIDEIEQIDLNPILISTKGVVAFDAMIALRR